MPVLLDRLDPPLLLLRHPVSGNKFSDCLALLLVNLSTHALQVESLIEEVDQLFVPSFTRVGRRWQSVECCDYQLKFDHVVRFV